MRIRGDVRMPCRCCRQTLTTSHEDCLGVGVVQQGGVHQELVVHPLVGLCALHLTVQKQRLHRRKRHTSA